MKLVDVCRIQYGFAFDSKRFSSDRGMPIIRIRDVVRGHTSTYTNEPFDDKYIVHDGELLVGMDGEFNISRWKGGDALLNQRVCCVRPSDKVDSEYVFFYLQHVLKEIEKKTSFVTVKHLSAKVLNSIELSHVYIDEQRRIAGQLSSIHKVVDSYQKLFALFELIIKSRFVEMFGDPVLNPNQHPMSKLSEIATYYGGLTYRPSDVVEEGGTIVLRSTNIQDGALAFDDVVRVVCEIKDRLYVKQNDILMCSRNGSAKLVGKTALINNLAEPMSFGAFMMIIRSEWYPYLLSYLRTQAFRSQVQTGTATINQITGRMLDSVVLPVPPIQLVKEFEVFVHQVDKSRFAVQQAIEQLELLKASLMQEYFG